MGAPGGMVLPNRCTIEVCAIADPERYDSLVGFWSDVYGYKMSCMRAPILEEASVEVVPNKFVVSNPVMFSTGPHVKPTHWKQTVFFLPEKLAVSENQVLTCKMVCKRMKTDARALKVALTVNEKTYRYTVD